MVSTFSYTANRDRVGSPLFARRLLPCTPVCLALFLFLTGPAFAKSPPGAGSSEADPRPIETTEPTEPKQRPIRAIEIDMAPISFSVRSVMVHAGETIRFILRNTSVVPHEFTVGTPGMQRIRRGFMGRMIKSKFQQIDPSARKKLESWNAVVVLPGEARELVWTFDETQNIEFGCNIHGHYEAGMKGQFRSAAVVDNGLDIPGIGRNAQEQTARSPQISHHPTLSKSEPPKATRRSKKPIRLSVQHHLRVSKIRTLWDASKKLGVQTERRTVVVRTNFNSAPSDRSGYSDDRGIGMVKKVVRGYSGGGLAVAAAPSSGNGASNR